MARFDVYPNPDSEDRIAVPYLLDVQNTFVDIETRVVIPLHAASRFHARVRDLNPDLVVQGKNVVLNTAALGAVPSNELRRAVANLAPQQALIQEALDILLGGY
ncbi:CcdB family protein [Ramlibacter sp. 2FC]|uniref:CcdB family protein n=1 Tax=Ramlibacter sp. 2FC TaxID=2502188 RepID=UPI0010F769BF|nr:CcdB family protein [Ramlibacter sp. 2FC]